MKHIFSKPSLWRARENNSIWNQYARYTTSKSATQAMEIKEENYVHRQRWKLHENLVLIEAKEKQEKELANAGNDGLHKTSNQKWEEIAVFCHQNGISRTGPQCKDKWHRLLNAFLKIKTWESCRPPGKKSFWQMKSDERNAEGLCFKLDKQIFDALDTMNNTVSDPFNISTDNEGQSAHQHHSEKASNTDGNEIHTNVMKSSGTFEKEMDYGKPHTPGGGDITIQPNCQSEEVGIHDCQQGQQHETVQHDEDNDQDERPPLIVHTILKSLNQLKQLE